MKVIFDLDGTVIDTSHRYRNGPDGHIDLEYWFENSTPEMIALDKLLPLADVMRRYYDEGHTVIICTARGWTLNHPLMRHVPGPMYEAFFEANGLKHHHLLYREMAGSDHLTMGDGELKTRLLNDLATREGWPSDWRKDACMFDDNVRVIEQMLRDRLMCFDAIKYNKRLAV